VRTAQLLCRLEEKKIQTPRVHTTTITSHLAMRVCVLHKMSEAAPMFESCAGSASRFALVSPNGTKETSDVKQQQSLLFPAH
jgi:hypothetical protein